MLFTKDINPMVFRQIAQEAQKVAASARECAVLADFYSKSPLVYQKDITTIIQKV